MTIFLASDELFCRLFFTDDYFYLRMFLPTFFYKREHLIFSNLKIPLV